MSGPDKAPMDPEARRTRQQQVLLFSGVGETAANLLQAPARTTSDGAVNVSSLAALGQAGLGAGAGSAGRRVADYLIRRAEQYQPVIQLQTGTRVTVVFIEGAWTAPNGSAARRWPRPGS